MMESKRLFGKYRILRAIGNGGFAQVYLGEHIYLRTRGAVKVLHVGAHLTSKELEEFLTEARIIAQLKHPHIVNILDFDIEEGIPYLVMGYAPHGSLLTRHPASAILQPQLILSYVRQIASALQFAHDRNVVHCDVKPENMLLGENDELLLTDFGIAVVLHNSIKAQQIVGTMHYMAPEQFVGKPLPASDQYALAVLVYRWLCGCFPFSGRNPLELQQLHESVPPPPLRTINPHISPGIDAVVLTALAKAPRERFASITAFATALEQAAYARQSLSSFVERKRAPSARPTPPQRQVITEPTLLPPSIVSLLPPADSALPAMSPALHLYAPSGSAHQPAITTLRAEPPVPRAPVGEAVHYEEQSGLTFREHTAWVSTVAWSPQESLIASGSWDRTVQVWDATTGKSTCVYQRHRQPVKSVAWSPDGRAIASASWDNTMSIWDAKTGAELAERYSHGAQIEVVAWSPDGSYVASAGHDGIVKVWLAFKCDNVANYNAHRGPVWSISWSPNGDYIASASHDGTVQIWKATTGEHVMTYDSHRQRVAAVAWSPDGKLIASSDYDGVVHVWESTNGQTQMCFCDETGAVKGLAWSPDGMRLASAVKLVQVRTIAHALQSPSAPYYTYDGHAGWVNAVSWSPNTQKIASASDDKTVQIWSPHAHQ